MDSPVSGTTGVDDTAASVGGYSDGDNSGGDGDSGGSDGDSDGGGGGGWLRAACCVPAQVRNKWSAWASARVPQALQLEICRRPAEASLCQHCMAHHDITGLACRRTFDTLSCCGRHTHIWVMHLLGLTVQVLGAYGLVSAADDPVFTMIFTEPAAFAYALAFYLAIPVLVFLLGKAYARVLGQAAAADSPGVRVLLYAAVSAFATALFMSIVWVGIAGGLVALEIAFFLWGAGLLTAWLVTSPLRLGALYSARWCCGLARRPDAARNPWCPLWCACGRDVCGDYLPWWRAGPDPDGGARAGLPEAVEGDDARMLDDFV